MLNDKKSQELIALFFQSGGSGELGELGDLPRAYGGGAAIDLPLSLRSLTSDQPCITARLGAFGQSGTVLNI